MATTSVLTGQPLRFNARCPIGCEACTAHGALTGKARVGGLIQRQPGDVPAFRGATSQAVWLVGLGRNIALATGRPANDRL